MTLEEFGTLLEALAGTTEFLTGFARVEDHLWGLESGDTEVTVTFHPDRNIVTLETPLGKPAESDRTAVYAVLLTVTGTPQGQRRIRMALDGPDGDVLQERDLQLGTLDSEQLLADLADFFDKSSRGRQLVERSHASVPACDAIEAAQRSSALV